MSCPFVQFRRNLIKKEKKKKCFFFWKRAPFRSETKFACLKYTWIGTSIEMRSRHFRNWSVIRIYSLCEQYALVENVEHFLISNDNSVRMKLLTSHQPTNRLTDRPTHRPCQAMPCSASLSLSLCPSVRIVVLTKVLVRALKTSSFHECQGIDGCA